jgi:hypothetical protein
MQAGREQHQDQGFGQHHQGIIAGEGGQGGQHQQMGCRAGRPERRFGAGGGTVGYRFGPAEQPIRPHHQNRGHDQEHQDQGDPGKDQNAERLQFADQHGGEKGAGDAAHAADHHDHEGFGDDVEIHVQIDCLTGDLQSARQPGQQRAQEQHPSEQAGLVDAQGRRHLAILGRRPHQGAPARAMKQQPEQTEHDRPERDQGQFILGKGLAENPHPAGQAGGARSQQIFRSPDRQRQILDDQHHAEGRQQLEQFG